MTQRNIDNMCMVIKISTKMTCFIAYSARAVSKGCVWRPRSNRLTYTCTKNTGDEVHNRNKLDCTSISSVGGKGGMDSRSKPACCHK